MNNKTDIDVKYVSPLKKICMTIGELPASYLETMSYYEMLVWFTEFLKNNVIPTVNNNAEAVQELQSLYEELRTYVNDYFDNLDVQDEINNKLEAMAESGQLTDIIAQYLGLAGMIAFDTVADMKLAENLVNGSKCQTLGFRTVNDGGKAIYKIRTITNDDIVDEMTIIALYDDSLIAELITEDEIIPEQLGAYGDGEHDDYNVINKCVSIAKQKLIPIKLNKTYLVETAIVLNDGDNITMIGNHTGKYGSYREGENIIIDDNSLFVGANLSNHQQTTVCLNCYGVKFSCVPNTKGTLFKGILFMGSTFEECQFTGLYGVLEGGFNFVSTLRNCQTLNIRNFFMSDYVFTTPTDMKDLRNGTTSISSVVDNFTIATADSPNLFDGGYYNGYNPNTTYSSLDMPCFHLLWYNDSEICGNGCFMDFWYAIEESYKTSGTSYAMSWKNCVFQECVYFFGFKNDYYPGLNTFEFIGNEMTTFGGDHTIISDVANYTDAKLSPHVLIMTDATIRDNYFSSANNKFVIKKDQTRAITSGNRYNLAIGCPLAMDTVYEWYGAGIIEQNRFDELNNQIYEVANVPTTIARTAGTNTGWDLYFNGRKFIFKVDDEYIPKTMIMIDSTTIAFV